MVATALQQLIFHPIVTCSYFRMALALLLTALAIPLLRQWKHIQLDPLSSLLAGLPVLAILSLILFSIDVNSALTEYCRYLILFIAYLYMKLQDHKQTQTIFYNAFIALGVFGMLAKLGISVMPSMVIAESGRMQSFLQYANTWFNVSKDLPKGTKVQHVLVKNNKFYAMTGTSQGGKSFIFSSASTINEKATKWTASTKLSKTGYGFRNEYYFDGTTVGVKLYSIAEFTKIKVLPITFTTLARTLLTGKRKTGHRPITAVIIPYMPMRRLKANNRIL